MAHHQGTLVCVAESSHAESQKLSFCHVEPSAIGDRCLFQVVSHYEMVGLVGEARDIQGVARAVDYAKRLQLSEPPLSHALYRLSIRPLT